MRATGVVLVALAMGYWYLSRFRPFKLYPQLIILLGAAVGLCLKG